MFSPLFRFVCSFLWKQKSVRNHLILNKNVGQLKIDYFTSFIIILNPIIRINIMKNFVLLAF